RWLNIPPPPSSFNSDIADDILVFGVTSLLPNCLHWNVPTTRNNSVPIRYLGLSQLRRYWHVDKAQISSPPHPPQLFRPDLLLKPSLWKVFWSLKMSSKAFTPWWRLLHNSLGHRIKLHRWNSSHFDTPVCGICGRANENLYHFSVGCIKKSNFWMDVYFALDKPDTFHRKWLFGQL
ncbi:hypothetical protein BDB01DRAFT_881665, partial [Pilobolus umbonatus]